MTPRAAANASLFIAGFALVSFELLFFHRTAVVFGPLMAVSVLTLFVFLAAPALGSGLAAARRAPPGPCLLSSALLLGLAYAEVSASAPVRLLAELPLRAGLLAAFVPLAAGLALLGGAFPALLGPRTEQAGSLETARRYLWQCAGSVAGPLLFGLYGIEHWGLLRCFLFALFLQATAGFANLGREPRGSRQAPPSPAGPGWAWASAAAFLAAGAFMIFEVVWTRLSIQFMSSSTYAFTSVLVAFLGAGLAGSYLATRLPKRSPEGAVRALLPCSVIAFALSAFLYSRFPAFVPDALLTTYGSAAKVQGYERLGILGSFITAVILVGAPASLLACVFPLLLRGSPVRPGSLLAVNLAGGGLGLALGAASLALWGCKGGFLLAAWLCLAAAVLPARGARPASGIKNPLALLALLVLLLTGQDPSVLSASVPFQGKPGKIEFLKESFEDTVAVLGYEKTSYKTLWVDNLLISARSDLFTAEDFYAKLPLGLRPDARRILVVGYGTGATSVAALRNSRADVDTVEISRTVLEAAGHFRSPAEYEDPRHRIIQDDGRRRIRRSPGLYDIIIVEASHLNSRGTASLYTREFYEECRRALAPDGVLVQWAPAWFSSDESYRILVKTFLAEFPRSSLWSTDASRDPQGNFVLLGIAGGKGEPRRGPYLDADALRRYAGQAEVMSDDRPVLEFRAARDVDSFFNGRGPREILEALAAVKPRELSGPVGGRRAPRS